MHKQTTTPPLSTIVCCSECAFKIGFNYTKRIGGTWLPDKCPYCGKERHLGEYYQNRNEAIRDQYP